ncbi:MAG: tRNA (guanosine(37)-N1)-methyltransferase TrmD [Planctomycetota bacterium]
MLCTFLTLFPDALRSYLDESILGNAQRIGRARFHLVDFRDFAAGAHRAVDDRPFGGGPGMVLRPEPIFDAITDVEARLGVHRKILLTPRGRRFSQAVARELAAEERLLFLCGRYEGYDERIRACFAWDELSLGDYVLAGGELAALVVAEATIRLLPGVLGHEDSAEQDSFTEGDLLDCPHYTRPREFRGMPVPEVLMSGDHEAVARWRRAEAERLTRERARREHDVHEPSEKHGSEP